MSIKMQSNWFNQAIEMLFYLCQIRAYEFPLLDNFERTHYFMTNIGIII